MTLRPTDGFEAILRQQIAESGRPLHPTFAGVLDGWVDPSARDFAKPDGEIISARERTIISVSSHHVAEGFMGGLTPLAMIAWAEAMLGFLGANDDEIQGGYHGVDVDPWGELRELPADSREEFARALWHVHEGLRKAGLERE